MIRIPVYMNEMITKWRKRKERLAQRLKRPPSDLEIAKSLKLPKDKIGQINFWMTSTTSSLEAPLGDESEGQVSDLIEDVGAVSPDASIGKLMDKERIDVLMDIMSDRERDILDMRFGLNNTPAQTLAEVAKKLNVSRERIRQIEEGALKKLKKFAVDQEKEL